MHIVNHTWFSIFETAHFWHSGTCPKVIFWDRQF